MQDRVRAQFLSAVVLVVVFAAGGLVGAAISGSGSGTDAAAGPVTAPESDQDEDRDDEDRDRRRMRMFEKAGATEEQVAYVDSAIIPWYGNAIEELENDSTVQALYEEYDEARDEMRSKWRRFEDHFDPRRDALRDSARALIRSVLDPPAQLAYDSILAGNRGGDRR